MQQTDSQSTQISKTRPIVRGNDKRRTGPRQAARVNEVVRNEGSVIRQKCGGIILRINERLVRLSYSDDDLDDVGSKGQGKVESNPLGVLDNVMGHVNKGIDLGMKYGFDMYQKASKWVGKTYDSLTNPKKSEL
eukprot:TRINITY_DN2183_c0_g1_i14.p2 TRINITY_DN2183_c0_g1~~TRINITY_DN2183_c0_g1_i14.p2  ORF type:complete len:134 (-),score=8.99 TRINITY_DN2183_c0_g1_i14:125-526(-)